METESISQFSNVSKIYECKYCNEKFHPLLAHDLHILSKHTIEWASTPFYPNSGVFSLATNDLLKIAHRELASLKSIAIDEVKNANSIFQWAPLAPSSLLTKKEVEEKADDIKNRKRLLDENEVDYRSIDRRESIRKDDGNDSGFGSGTRGRERDSSTDRAKRRRGSSTSTLGSGGDGLGIPSMTSSTIEAQEPKRRAWIRPRNITAFVTRSVQLSRRNRLASVGKPYYLQRSPRRADHRPRNRKSIPSRVETFAFRCYPKSTSGGKDENKQAAIYVFQPSDAADLLRNLTWKATKALRQRQGNGQNANGPKEIGEQTPRFKRHRHSLVESSRDHTVKERSEERRYLFEINQYKNQAWYSQRLRRGRIYDARLSRVQAESESTCEIKNSIHLYLLQTSAGERAASLKEIIDRKKIFRSQSSTYSSTKSSR